jgi:hypothetical protein
MQKNCQPERHRTPGDIISECPGDFIGTPAASAEVLRATIRTIGEGAAAPVSARLRATCRD